LGQADEVSHQAEDGKHGNVGDHYDSDEVLEVV